MGFQDIQSKIDKKIPELLGTSKQVKWALQIRNKYLERYVSIINDPDYPILKKEWEQIIFELSIEHNSAPWWIDSRKYF